MVAEVLKSVLNFKQNNCLFFLLTPLMKLEQSVPKRRHINFRRRGITKKKNTPFIVCYLYTNLIKDFEKELVEICSKLLN